MMGIVRFTPALLADNLDQVLPRGWRGANFVGWEGGSAAGAEGGPGATWLALFWSEVSLLDVASVPGLGQWPLIPITTGELISCSMLQQVAGSTYFNGVSWGLCFMGRCTCNTIDCAPLDLVALFSTACPRRSSHAKKSGKRQISKQSQKKLDHLFLRSWTMLAPDVRGGRCFREGVEG